MKQNEDEELKNLSKAALAIIMFAIVTVAVLMFSSCNTAKCVPEIVVHDSIRTEYAVKYDSVYQYIHDSTFIKEKGDTVFFTKYKTVYKDKYVMKNDTVYKSVDHKVVEKETTNVLTSSQKGMIRGFWWLLILLILSILGLVGYEVVKRTPWGKAAWIAIKAFFGK